MILDVPFFYTAHVLPPRKRNATEKTYVATVTVAIREASPEEAPVALRVPHFDWHREPTVVRDDIRVLDGVLYRPLRVQEASGEPSVVKDPTWLRARVAAGDHYTNPLPQGERPYRTEPVRIEDDPEATRILSNNRAEREGAVVEHASRLMICGGVLWSRTAEPVYVHGRGRGSPVEVADSESLADKYADHVFRADQERWMLDVYFAGNIGSEVPEASRIEVLMPEVLAFPADEKALHWSARRLVDAMANTVAHQDMAFFSAYQQLRDGGGRTESWTDCDLPELAARLQRAAAAMLAADPHDWNGQEAARVIERWRSDPRRTAPEDETALAI